MQTSVDVEPAPERWQLGPLVTLLTVGAFIFGRQPAARVNSYLLGC